MLFWVIKIILSSAIIIFLINNILSILSDTLTIPKVKDLVQITNKNYENIYNILSTNNPSNDQINTELNDITIDSTPINLLPTSDSEESIKSELKNYLKEQLNVK